MIIMITDKSFNDNHVKAIFITMYHKNSKFPHTNALRKLQKV